MNIVSVFVFIDKWEDDVKGIRLLVFVIVYFYSIEYLWVLFIL